jgi:uncharacterized membrane protein
MRLPCLLKRMCKCIYFTLLSIFMINMHINLLLIHTSHFIVWQDYETAFSNAADSSLEYIRERLCMFIVSKIINPKGEFYYNIEN